MAGGEPSCSAVNQQGASAVRATSSSVAKSCVRSACATLHAGASAVPAHAQRCLSPKLQAHLLPPVRGAGRVWCRAERDLCRGGVLRAALELCVKPAAEGVHGAVLQHPHLEGSLGQGRGGRAGAKAVECLLIALVPAAVAATADAVKQPQPCTPPRCNSSTSTPAPPRPALPPP